MANDWIRIRGARTHNLKNVNVDIRPGTLTVITGPQDPVKVRSPLTPFTPKARGATPKA